MGLGPSTKMTTLHHFNCPITKQLRGDKQLDFCGIIVNGVSEGYDDKVFTAQRTADIASCMKVDGAIVAIDGWGNHLIDFVNVIEQLGIRGIPSVGMSYIGQQGRLVCTNQFVETIIDFNKNASGYESCIIGDNNLNEYDAMKAVALLKRKLEKMGKLRKDIEIEEKRVGRLIRKNYPIQDIQFGRKTEISRGVLTIRKDIAENFIHYESPIKEMDIRIIKPNEHHQFIHSNLDFMPIACKKSGNLGDGETRLLTGVTAMLTGIEEVSGFQPSNIGSSEGYMDHCIRYNQAGTPEENHIILHIDFLFRNGEGRTTTGIRAAHQMADRVLEEIRMGMNNIEDKPYATDVFYDVIRPNASRVLLVKIVSGLGNMYETAVFPNQPCGYIGARNLIDMRNIPVVITPNQCLDGGIHSLI
ncbi:glycine/sarcosine/betaine reductase component B subunit [Anaerotignum propionicum]|uniref:glycine/sarcosine/betaine reductase component B subunit n=1 Tax=Anaerotignum propionicum TaxID=28446 RepID=UPI00210D0D40|nr:glycine/sarcosine/betaine reductase component B subunit [Anaerotignum propionicum]MCQ4935272.1 glycine/sarcosine/betaine reductase component B subunit [Anaerotignum propionicum]